MPDGTVKLHGHDQRDGKADWQPSWDQIGVRPEGLRTPPAALRPAIVLTFPALGIYLSGP